MTCVGHKLAGALEARPLNQCTNERRLWTNQKAAFRGQCRVDVTTGTTLAACKEPPCQHRKKNKGAKEVLESFVQNIGARSLRIFEAVPENLLFLSGLYNRRNGSYIIQTNWFKFNAK